MNCKKPEDSPGSLGGLPGGGNGGCGGLPLPGGGLPLPGGGVSSAGMSSDTPMLQAADGLAFSNAGVDMPYCLATDVGLSAAVILCVRFMVCLP